MDQVDVCIEEIEIQYNKMVGAIRHFEKFIRVVNPKNLKTILSLSQEGLELVLATFQETEVASKIPWYDVCSVSLLEFYEEVKEYSLSDVDNVCIAVKNEEIEMENFLTELKLACKEKVEELKKTEIKFSGIISILKELDKATKSRKYVTYDKMERLFHFYEIEEDLKQLDFIVATIMKNDVFVQEKKQQLEHKKIYSSKELEDMKRNQYKKQYGLELDDSITLTSIEQILEASSFIGIEYLKKHPEVFYSKKELYLSNLDFIKTKNISLELVLDRDSEAFICPNLKDNIELISRYMIDINELLFYRKKALTDLSYFGVLDLMIENQCFDLRKLLDIRSIEIKKRTMMRLLGFSNLDFLKKTFPVTEEELDTFLESKSTILKNEHHLYEKSILDVYQIDERTYNLNGVLVSRPKVLRNMENENMVSIDEVWCNSFFTNEEKDSLMCFLHELKDQRQKQK